MRNELKKSNASPRACDAANVKQSDKCNTFIANFIPLT